jgi:hypothetical protein
MRDSPEVVEVALRVGGDVFMLAGTGWVIGV